MTRAGLEPALIVIAKSPAPGRSKTRLCPPCSPEQAAALAEAALADTLDAVAAAPVERRALVLDGEPGPWLPGGFELHEQASGGLDTRLAAAFEDVGGPAVLVGMDTPQLTPGLLEASVQALTEGPCDAVLGAALDGGYWAIGLREPRPDAFAGVPMSTSRTARAQRLRLRELGIRCGELPPLLDVDTFEDAVVVARDCPASRFAAELGHVRSALEPAAHPGIGAGR